MSAPERPGSHAASPAISSSTCSPLQCAGRAIALRLPTEAAASPPVARHGALHQLVVVAVHRQPRHAAARSARNGARTASSRPGTDGKPYRARGRSGSAVSGCQNRSSQTCSSATPSYRSGSPESGDDVAAVEQREVPVQLVGLGVVGVVAGDDREVDGRAADRAGRHGVDGARRIAVDDLGGQQLLRPVGADLAEQRRGSGSRGRPTGRGTPPAPATGASQTCRSDRCAIVSSGSLAAAVGAAARDRCGRRGASRRPAGSGR